MFNHGSLLLCALRELKYANCTPTFGLEADDCEVMPIHNSLDNYLNHMSLIGVRTRPDSAEHVLPEVWKDRNCNTLNEYGHRCLWLT